MQPTAPLSPEDRLLKLMEKWGRDAGEMTVTMAQIRELMSANTNLQRDVKDEVEVMEGLLREHNTALALIREHCREVWAKTEKQSGVRGFFDWMFERAAKNPAAFALVFMTTVAAAFLSIAMGWDVPALVGKLFP